jgi:hypothetical protein
MRFNGVLLFYSSQQLESTQLRRMLGQLSNHQCLEKYPAPLVVKDIFGFWVCTSVDGTVAVHLDSKNTC